MSRCGCADGTCSCVVRGGAGMAITGSGSTKYPYVISLVTNPSATGLLGLLTEESRSNGWILGATSLGKMQVCTVAAAFTLTLPTPVGVTGNQIGIRVTNNSIRLLTVSTPSGTIDGLATRIMWAGESAILESDGVNWVKIAGKSLAMKCILRMAAAQTLPNAVVTTALLDTVVIDNTGLMALVPSNGISIQRPGTYFIGARVSVDTPATQMTRFLAMAYKGATVVVQQEISPAIGNLPSFQGSDDIVLAASDLITLRSYQACTTPATRNFAVGSAPASTALNVRELPAW